MAKKQKETKNGPAVDLKNVLPSCYKSWAHLFGETRRKLAKEGTPLEPYHDVLQFREIDMNPKSPTSGRLLTYEFDVDYIKARIFDDCLARLASLDRDDIHMLRMRSQEGLRYSSKAGTPDDESAIRDIFQSAEDICG